MQQNKTTGQILHFTWPPPDPRLASRVNYFGARELFVNYSEYRVDFLGGKCHILPSLLTSKVGYLSGQQGQTVNLLDNSFQGSNP